jgi:hypothetical protein
MANRFGASRLLQLLSLPAASGGHYGMPNPADLAGVTLWLDAAANVTQSGGAVSQWNSRRGAASFVQATPANQPEFLSSAVNGLPAIRFNGATKHMTSSFALSSAITAAAYSTFIVGRVNGGAVGANPWDSPAFVMENGFLWGAHTFLEAANAPTIRTGDTNASSGSNVTSFAVTKPSASAIRNGDYICVASAVDGTGSTFTGMETFTDQTGAGGDSTNHQGKLWTRRANYSEPASYTVGISASEQHATRAFVVEGAGSIDFTTSDVSVSNRTTGSVSGTVTDNDSLAVVLCYSESGSANTITAPDGTWTQLGGANLVAGTGATGATLAVFYKTLPSGATGTLTFTQTALEEFIVGMIVFRPKANAVQAHYNWDGNADTIYSNMDSGAWNVMMYRHTGGNIANIINNNPISQNIASGNTTALTGVLALGSTAGAVSVNHDVAEIIIANAALSAADEAGILYYLNQKYAVY